MTSLPKLIILVPAYNEAERIAETVKALKAQVANMKDVDAQVYVINDGSKDNTAQIANDAGADRVITHNVNRGLGAAIRTGLGAARKAGADIALKFDADLQHDPADIPALIKPILDDTSDIVYGHRFERIEYKMPPIRKYGNKVFLGLMRWLTGWPLKDSQPGIFAVNNRYLQVFSLPGDYNYTQQILLDAYLKSMRFEHADVAFRRRETGKSFISLKYPFKVLPQIIMVLIAVRPLRVFGPIGFAFLALAAFVFFGELLQYALSADIDKPVRSVNLVLGAGLFGVQTLFFGLLAELIVYTRRT